MEHFFSVNLGGWFVLERWMKPELFDETLQPARCETSFVLNHPNPKEALEKHWQTWITEEDLKWLKNKGITVVRIPIPWWLFPEQFPSEFPYVSPIHHIDRAMDMLDRLGMKAMLDLHTAPGSQNGFDNGGIDGVRTWHEKDENIQVTITVLEEIAKRWKDHPALHSLQVLNEPHHSIPMEIIESFYDRAYPALRKILKPETPIVFHDAFRFGHWYEFFQNRQWHNVVLDTHVYQCFDGKFELMDEATFLNYPFQIVHDLKRMEEVIPVVVGEWSLGARLFEGGMNRDQFERQFAQNQIEAYSALTGTIFWAYKIKELQSGWNFRSLVERGLMSF